MWAAYVRLRALVASAKLNLFCFQVEFYEYLPGMEELLSELSSAGVEMHAMSNYPVWYENIEAKLKLTKFLPWTFVSSSGVMKVRGQAWVPLLVPDASG